MKPVFLLPVVGPVQVFAEWALWGFIDELVHGKTFARAVSRVVEHSFMDGKFLVSFAVLAASSLVGIMIGYTVAVYLLRTGRWETIVPVGKSRRT